MKKLNYFAFMLVMVLYISFSFAYADNFGYNRYALQEDQGTANKESYLLRGTYYDTFDRDTGDYKGCYTGINTESDAIYPLRYYYSEQNSSYTSAMIIGSYASKVTPVYFYSADCSKLDTINVSGRIIGEPLILNSDKIYTQYSMPKIIFLVKAPDSYIYFVAYTLRAEDSKFIQYQTIKTDIKEGSTADRYHIFGLAGGCQGVDNNCNDSMSVAGFYVSEFFNDNAPAIYIWNLDELTYYKHSLNANDYESEYPVSIKYLKRGFDGIPYNSKNFFYEKWNTGEGQKFIIAGLRQYYDILYYVFVTIDYNVLNNALAIDKSFTNTIDSGMQEPFQQIQNNMPIFPCQLGSRASSMEICIDINMINYPSLGNYAYKVVYDHYADNILTNGGSIYQSAQSLSTDVILDIDNDNYLDYGLNGEGFITFYSGYGYTEMGGLIVNNTNYWNLDGNTPIMTMFSYNINKDDYLGYDTITGLLYSNGEAYEIYNHVNGSRYYTSQRVNNWYSPDFSTDPPYIVASDLNDDGDKEIITSDSHTLTIHSLDISPFILQNISRSDYYNISEVEYGGFTPTTTTTLYNPQQGNYSNNILNRLFGAISDNGRIIACLIVIITFVIVSYRLSDSVILMILSGFMGLILSFILGFIAKGVLVGFIIFIVIMAVLGIAVMGKK